MRSAGCRVAEELLLAFADRRDVGRHQEVLAMDLEAVAGEEEQGHVARLDRLVECQ